MWLWRKTSILRAQNDKREKTETSEWESFGAQNEFLKVAISSKVTLIVLVYMHWPTFS